MRRREKSHSAAKAYISQGKKEEESPKLLAASNKEGGGKGKRRGDFLIDGGPFPGKICCL